MSQLVHEVNDRGQHRLVKIHDDSTNESSDWVEFHSLATLGKFLAHTGGVSRDLPLGVFTVREVAHQVLP